MRVLVSGAGGFLGGWITESLYLSGRAEVRAGIHRWESAARIASYPVEIAKCDVLDPATLSEALRGIDAIVHCAISNDYKVSTEGTRNMLEAAGRANIPRFIHVSSVAVYGDSAGTVSETAELKPVSQYGRAKAEAEKACAYYREQGLPTVVLRPSNIYGPFSQTWTVNYAQRLESGRWGTLGSRGEGLCNLVYVSDVVDLICQCLTSPAALGGTFNVNGGEIITWNDYFGRFNEVLGLPPLGEVDPRLAGTRAVVTRPIRAIGKYLLKTRRDEFVWLCNRSDNFKSFLKLTEDRLKSTPNLDDMKAYQLRATYSIESARKALSYFPKVRLADGLQECAAWLRRSGLISSTRSGRAG